MDISGIDHRMKRFIFYLPKPLKGITLYRFLMKLTDRCISCGKGLIEKGFVTFPCPICSTPIGRCVNCREQGVEYVCSKCGFKGP